MRNSAILTAVMIVASSWVPLSGAEKRDSIIINDSGVQVIGSDFIKNARFHLGPDIFWVNNHPHFRNVRVNSHSVYYGLRLGYDYFRPNTLYGGFDALWAFGRTHLNAQTKLEDLYKNTTSASFANVEGRLGYNFYSPKSLYLSPYVGLGGYCNRPMQSAHYREAWLYGALGLKLNCVFTPIFTAGLDVKGMKTFYLNQYIQTRKLSHNKKKKICVRHRNVSNIFGYGISLPFSWKMGDTKAWDIQFEPYYLKLSTKSDLNVAGAHLTFGYLF
jgi:hypothetical protein